MGRNNCIAPLVEAIEEASGIEADKTHSSEIPGDVKQTWADVSKAKALLNYRSDFDLDRGLRNFLNWYKKNKTIPTSPK